MKQHVNYGGGDDREGRPAGEVVAGAVDFGATGGNVEASDAQFEP